MASMPWRAAIRNCANTTGDGYQDYLRMRRGDAGHTIAWQLQSPAPPPITQGVPEPSDPEVARPYGDVLACAVAAGRGRRNRHAPRFAQSLGSGVTVESHRLRLCSSCRKSCSTCPEPPVLRPASVEILEGPEISEDYGARTGCFASRATAAGARSQSWRPAARRHRRLLTHSGAIPRGANLLPQLMRAINDDDISRAPVVCHHIPGILRWSAAC